MGWVARPGCPSIILFLTQAPARVGAFSLRQKLCGKRAAAT